MVSHKTTLPCYLQESLGVFTKCLFVEHCLTVGYSHATLESRVLAGYVAGVSMLIILVQAACKSSYGRVIKECLLGTKNLTNAHVYIVPTGSYVSSHGGWTILLCQSVRLVANLVLFALVILTTVRSKWSVIGDIALLVNLVSGQL
jgi:hypothetical protein